MTGLLVPLTIAELGALDRKMVSAQLAFAATAGVPLSLSPQGVHADLADVRREINDVYPWMEQCEACIGRECHCDHPARAAAMLTVGPPPNACELDDSCPACGRSTAAVHCTGD